MARRRRWQRVCLEDVKSQVGLREMRGRTSAFTQTPNRTGHKHRVNKFTQRELSQWVLPSQNSSHSHAQRRCREAGWSLWPGQQNRYRYIAAGYRGRGRDMKNHHMKRPTPDRSLYKNTHIVAAFMAAYHRPSSATPQTGTSLA